MNELDLQDKYIINFLCERQDGLQYKEAEEIYNEFSKLYRKYTIIKKDLGDFFKRETKDRLNQLCDDFEKTLR